MEQTTKEVHDHCQAKRGMHLIDTNENLLQAGTFGYLAAMALVGRIRGILGGPPCRTYSPCRLLPGGPPVVRFREGEERWGRVSIPPKGS